MARIRWDAGAVKARLRSLDGNLRRYLRAGALEVGGVLLKDAVHEVPQVPLRTGTLRTSGMVEATATRTKATAVVGFNTPYAAVMHEGGWLTGPLAGKMVRHWSTPGTGPKFLERKMQRHAKDYLGTFAQILAERSGMD